MRRILWLLFLIACGGLEETEILTAPELREARECAVQPIGDCWSEAVPEWERPFCIACELSELSKHEHGCRRSALLDAAHCLARDMRPIDDCHDQVYSALMRCE